MGAVSAFKLTVISFAFLLALPCAAGAGEFAANHYICSSANGNLLREFDLNGILVREFGASAGLSGARAMAFGPNGHLYIINSGTSTILELNSDGQKVNEIGAGASLSQPSGLAFGQDGHLFVTSQSPDRIVEFDAAGQNPRDLALDAGLIAPHSISISPRGHLFVTSSGTNSIVELGGDGAKIAEISDPSLASPTSLTIGADGKLYVLSPSAARIFVFTIQGALDRTMGASLDWQGPSAMVPGPDGNIYVADAQRIRVYVISSLANYVRHMDGVFAGDAPAGIVLSPIRFSARITGGRAQTGTNSNLLRENGIISYFPGAQTAMLQIENTNNARDIASLFGATAFTFRGTDRFVSQDPVARAFDGAQWQNSTSSPGVASLAFQSFGFIDEGGAYSPVRVKGTLHRGSGSAVVAATVTSLLRIN